MATVKSPDEQVKELYSAKTFVVRSRYDGDATFAMKVHYAKAGKSLQEFMVWLKEDQPHLRCKPFWSDGGKAAIEIMAEAGEKVRWKMPTDVPHVRVIMLHVERLAMDMKIYEAVVAETGDPASESEVNMSLNRSAYYMASRFQLSGFESLDEFLFHESYRMASEESK